MLHAFDFESEAIEDRPKYPPKPVGLAHYDGEDAVYLAWGHPSGNNCTERDGVAYAKTYFADEDNEFVCHNLAFDGSIFEEKWDIMLPWDRMHDTMLQAFLLDPYGELGLKPLADRYLQLPPTEQDMLELWLVRHGFARAGSKTWGAHISKAPGDVVSPYARGDVIRTWKLYYEFQRKLVLRGMM